MRRARLLLAGLGTAAAALASACGDEARAGAPAIELVDVGRDAGIDLVNRSGDARRWYIPESNGCGAALLDYDTDGDLDVFVANGSSMRYRDDGRRLDVPHDGETRLYQNQGRMGFRDATAEAGARRHEWINGLATGDVDDDGDPDLYLACFDPDVLLWNAGGELEDRSESSGLGCALWGAAAAFGDADADGDLDLYVANYCLFDPEHPPLEGRRNVVDGVEVAWGPEEENRQGANAGAPDAFFLNDGRGHFSEATDKVGLALEKALCSYAVVFADVDMDGRQDLLVANDLQPSNLFHNKGNDADGRPRFAEEGAARGFAYDAAGAATGAMGLAVDDFDQDGDLDVFKTNFDFEANGLYVNDGTGRFADRAAQFGLAEPSKDRLGWGCGFLDVELDGDLDLLVANGHVYPQAARIGMSDWAQLSQLFEARREDGRLTYVDATARAGPGLAVPRSARGLALGDLDDDGDVDAVLVDIGERPRVLENRSERGDGRWVAVRTVGRVSNRDGYGALVQVFAGGRIWTRQVGTAQGLYGASDPRLHFGLGPVASIERIEVRWPSGLRSLVAAPPLDNLVTVHEPQPDEPEEPTR